MTRPKNLARLAVALLALTLIAAACGNDDDTTTTSSDDAPAADEMAMDDGESMDHGDDHGDHAHGDLEYDGDTVPTVELVVEEDPMSGWNVFAAVSDDYTFAPESASTEHVAGEGHAHVYVDEEKLGRVYGESLHIAKLEPGTHTITYALSANDHSEYVVDGEPLAAEVTVEVPESDDAGGHSHGHEPREWDADTTPSVDVAVTADPKAGWNVIATVEGFTITPEAASTEHVPGEGHMHLYVNGERIGRIYEPAIHLMELPAGTNEVEIRLSGNDHSDYTIDGELVAGTAGIEVSEADGADMAMGDDGHDHDHGDGGGAMAMDDDTPADMTIEAAYEAGSVETDESRYDVSAGEVVRIEVVSDVAEELHVHGYDLYDEVSPDEPAVVVFDASIPGVFEVELEDSATLLFELAVR